MNEKQLAPTHQGNVLHMQEFTADQVNLIKSQIAKGATNDELQLFLHLCKRTGLDPFARQIYAIQRKEYDKATGTKINKMSFQVSVDGLRLVAGRSDKYQGQVGPFWCGQDGVWKDVWLAQEYPAASKVGVWKVGFKEPLYAVAHWNEYVQAYDGKPSKMWAEKPALMLAKCSESMALRKAFPQELSGLYTSEEMSKSQPPEGHPPALPPSETPPQSKGPVVLPKEDLNKIGDAERSHIIKLAESRKWSHEQVATFIERVFKQKAVDGLSAPQYQELTAVIGAHTYDQALTAYNVQLFGDA